MSAAREVPGWEPPASFDSFVVERPLGAGGMGHVYLGRDVMLDRLVALKFIAQANPGEEVKQRFIIEARAIAKLAHPNVVSVFRIGEVEGKPYIAYELVAGRSFDRLARPMPWATALRIGLLLCRGLDAAHKAGIVHRDIKPANVMLSDAGEVKLLDFGIAKLEDTSEPRASQPPRPAADPNAPFDASMLERRPASFGGATTVRAALTRPGALVGTPAYLAPEIWVGEPATVRSDVFAAGLILWELLTGALPFAPLVGEALARAVVLEDVPSIRGRRPDIPQSFADIVDRCVRRHPLARWESGTELRAALEEVSAVFLPRSGNVDHVHLDDEAHAVAASFTRILPRAMEFTSSVYDKLFAADPSLKTLFPGELHEQKTKLAHALRVAVEGLREPERLVPFLQDLGRRHVAYGVQAAHFDTLGAVLHATLREFDSEHWSGELSSAWRSAYGFLATAMRQGLGASAQTSITGDGDAPLWPASQKTPAAEPASASPPTPPRTRYAQSGSVSLAFHVTGDGPVDLVVMMGWLSHVELAYAHPTLANFLRRLSRRHRVILFDKRGTGLSDRVGDPTSFSQHLEDIRVVMDAADSERAVFLGIGEAAAVATLFAAVHPERTLGVVAFGGSARPTRDPSTVDAVADTIRTKWGEPLFADVVAPSQAGDAVFNEWQGTYLRMAGSPSNAIALLKANASLDIRKVAPAVGAPMLVVHRKGDRLVPVERGRELASLVLRSQLVELEGDDHLPFVGDVAKAIDPIESFTGDLAKEASTGERVVGHPVAAIVALSSVVDAEVAGRAAVATGRLVGLESKDAVYAFESIDHAVAFARTAVREKHAARAGVHVGPCAARSPSLATPAVIEARRLAANASEGGVGFSDTLRDLAFGVDLSA